MTGIWTHNLAAVTMPVHDRPRFMPSRGFVSVNQIRETFRGSRLPLHVERQGTVVYVNGEPVLGLEDPIEI